MRAHHFLLLIALVLALSSCRVQPLLRSSSPLAVDSLWAMDTLLAQPIKADDKLTVSVWNHDELSVGSLFTIYNTNESFGKWLLVDERGVVMLPGLGPVRLGGLTCSAAQDTLRTLYAKNLVDPVVVVKVLNRTVTVLGEVRSPGGYVMEKERVTLGEVLGMTQGLTDFADNSKVEVVRNGVSYRVDMTVLDEQRANAIVLRSGDLVNVPSRNHKALAQRANIIIPFASAITAVALILSVAGK
jgi:polysaccharide biosynthesis/export protein